MVTQNNLHLPEELLARLQIKAQSDGKTVDETAEETLWNGLEDGPWQELIACAVARLGIPRTMLRGWSVRIARDTVSAGRNRAARLLGMG